VSGLPEPVVRVTATAATAGMVMGGIFLVFGVGLLAVAWVELGSARETGLRIALGLFLMVWVAGCSAIVVFMARFRAAARSLRPGAPPQREEPWGRR
jgi:hypothetical protein